MKTKTKLTRKLKQLSQLKPKFSKYELKKTPARKQEGK